jgi:hypothetical protein
MGLFEYPITKPINLGKWGIVAFWIIAICYVVFITLLNIIAVGYEEVLVTLMGTTLAGTLWYENLPLSSFLPASTSCNPAQLSINERLVELQTWLTSKVVSTTNNIFWYQVIWDIQGPSQLHSALDYWGDPVNCSPDALWVTPGYGEVYYGVNQTLGVRHLSTYVVRKS